MAYIPIPTGQKIITAVSSSDRILYYRCAECQRDIIDKYRISASYNGTYHVFQSKNRKQSIVSSTEERARQGLSQTDRELFEGINEKREYGGIRDAVICPHCGAVQPWSDNKRTLPGILWCLLSLAALAAVAWLSTRARSSFPAVLIVPAALCAMLGFQWGRSVFARRKGVKELSEVGAPLPVYFNGENASCLYNEPYLSILKDGFICPSCGALADRSAASCPKCHAPYDAQPWEGRAIRRGKNRRRVGTVWLCMAIIFMCVGIWFQGVNQEYAVGNLEEASFNMLELKHEYRASVMVADAYGYLKGGKNGKDGIDVLYLAGITQDQDGMRLCNVATRPGDGIFDAVQRYLDDDTQQIGDLRVDGIFTVKIFVPPVALGSSREAVFDHIQSQLGLASDSPGRSILLDYYSPDDMVAYAQKRNGPWHTAGILFYGVAALMAAIGAAVYISGFTKK